MKKLIIGAAFVAAALPAMAQTGVSISVGQPGFYGRIDIGDFARPQVVYTQPVIIEQRHYRAEPVYLRVPPGHRKNWRKHCAKYGACGQPVYFVRDQWYNNVVVPRYREHHAYAAPVRYEEHGGGHGGRGRDHDDRGKGHGKGHGHGNGHGNGKGHGKGHD